MSRVAILGAGGIGCGAAALLSERGHAPVLWSPSGRGTAAFADGTALQAQGQLTGQYHPTIAPDCPTALRNADAVMLAVPGYGHRAVLDQLAEHLRPDQPVIISSHMSLGALYLTQRLTARGVRASIAAWGTTVTTGRRLPGPAVRVSNIRDKVDIATLPSGELERTDTVSRPPDRGAGCGTTRGCRGVWCLGAHGARAFSPVVRRTGRAG